MLSGLLFSNFHQTQSHRPIVIQTQNNEPISNAHLVKARYALKPPLCLSETQQLESPIILQAIPRKSVNCSGNVHEPPKRKTWPELSSQDRKLTNLLLICYREDKLKNCLNFNWHTVFDHKLTTHIVFIAEVNNWQRWVAQLT